MLDTMSLHPPNYDLEWRLHPDASSVAVGSGLYQIFINIDSSKERQLIGLYSKKLSPVAQRWDTIKQETYAIASSVKFFADLLGGKSFLIECDHNNLCLDKLALCLTPIVVRWRLYLQSFSFLIRHIPGKQNYIGDFLSRMYGSTQDPLPSNTPEELSQLLPIDEDQQR